MTKPLFVIACAVLVTGCSDFARVTEPSPLALTPVPVATPPSPPPVFRFEEPYTQLIIGSTFQRTVDKSANPDCIGVPGFGCQYFRVTPDRDGVLDVVVTWVRETQPNQGLDLTLESLTTGQVWADIFGGASTNLRSRVKAGETLQITVWYTFPGIEFSLRTQLEPN